MKKKLEISMEVIHAHAAGVDIGSKSHWVAVDQNPQAHRMIINYNHFFCKQLTKNKYNMNYS